MDDDTEGWPVVLCACGTPVEEIDTTKLGLVECFVCGRAYLMRFMWVQVQGEKEYPPFEDSKPKRKRRPSVRATV